MGWTSDLLDRLEAASASGITLSPAEVRGLVRYVRLFESSPGLFSSGTAQAAIDTQIARDEANEARLRPDPPGCFATLEVEECEGDDVDFDGLAESLSEAGYKLRGWTAGWHLLARSALLQVELDIVNAIAIGLGGREDEF